MRRPVFVLFLLAASCGDNDVPTPVDMTYQIDIRRTEDTCDEFPDPWPDLHPQLDAVQWPGGRVELRGLPLQGYAIGPMPVLNGNIGHEGLADGDSNRGWQRFPYEVGGKLTMERVDLTVVSHEVRYDDPAKACTQRWKVAGLARGFLDTNSLDGEYILGGTPLGVSCPTGFQPASSASPVAFELDANLRTDGIHFLLRSDVVGHVLGVAAVSEADHRLTVRQAEYFVSDPDAGAGLAHVPGSLEGLWSPGDVDLELAFAVPDRPGCFDRYRLEGRKRLASPDSIIGSYRSVSRFRFEDTCGGSSFTVSYLETFGVRESFPGRLFIVGGTGNVMATRSGSHFHSHVESDEGYRITVDGEVDPPHLRYRMTEWLSEPCSVSGQATMLITTTDVDAVSRFFPRLGWSPPFLPDEPK